jgi:isopenicillin-N N-acyltransferase-like protein
LLRIHMLAGLTQGKCSMLGAWGIALDPNSGTNLLQLRALDWDMNGPFRDFSQITVYHPAPGYGHAFANVGFTGFIGGLTGVSQAQLGISEIGVAYPDSSFGEESRIGVPFIFLLRDILQFDYTLDDALNRMINTRRTCDLLLGVGDGKLNQFRGVQYSYSVMNVFDDMNLRPINNTWHPRIPNVVYWAMDWLCPGYSTLMSRQLQKYHGKLSPAVGIQYVSPYEGSGDNHIAYYDLTKMQLYVSFAAPHNTTGPVAAYDRQYTQWDLRSLFAEPAP